MLRIRITSSTFLPETAQKQLSTSPGSTCSVASHLVARHQPSHFPAGHFFHYETLQPFWSISDIESAIITWSYLIYQQSLGDTVGIWILMDPSNIRIWPDYNCYSNQKLPSPKGVSIQTKAAPWSSRHRNIAQPGEESLGLSSQDLPGWSRKHRENRDCPASTHSSFTYFHAHLAPLDPVKCGTWTSKCPLDFANAEATFNIWRIPKECKLSASCYIAIKHATC